MARPKPRPPSLTGERIAFQFSIFLFYQPQPHKIHKCCIFINLNRKAPMKKIALAILLCLVCYFTKAQITYVDKNASGLNDGSSWTNAYTNLNTALTNTFSGQMWVAAAIYYPGNPGQNNNTFLLKSGVEIYGGFNGTETLLNQRNPSA